MSKNDLINFCLWIANDVEHFKIYEHYENFIVINFTEKQQAILHPRFKKYYEIDYYASDKQIAQRKKEFEKLKAEFEPEIFSDKIEE